MSAFLRIPPFPGHRGKPLAEAAAGDPGDAAELVAALRAARVGGAFWASPLRLPETRDVLLAPESAPQARWLQDEAEAEGLAQCAAVIGPWASRHGIPVFERAADPWELAAHAAEVRAGAGHELALVAALSGKPVRVTGEGRFAALDGSAAGVERAVAQGVLAGWRWRDPFSDRAVPAVALVPILAEWRALIEGNREIAAVFGIARWKRLTLDALLWGGSGAVPYARDGAADRLEPGARALVWAARARVGLVGELDRAGVLVGEIEDGFLRSTGLGANCVPPLSVIVDGLGAHFDPSRPSMLEAMLAGHDFALELLERAAALRGRLVAEGIGKYGAAGAVRRIDGGRRRRVLVCAQVEDDRAVLLGGAGMTNLALLRRARELEPEAEIIFRPHPDVEAGHRKGAVPDVEALDHADRIERHAAIGTLFAEVDAVHVISSLAGFEALLRGLAVTTHGVPFYAGWGLTRDLGPVPERRGRQRSLDELVAAALILYPRYLDPVTRLPCGPEVLVERIARGQAGISSPLVKLREVQGALNKRVFGAR